MRDHDGSLLADPPKPEDLARARAAKLLDGAGYPDVAADVAAGRLHPNAVLARLDENRRALEAELELAGGRPPRRALSPADVIAAMRAEGPLVHEPLGLEALDASTGGGPIYGSRWYVLGAPDASKTALLVHIAHTLASRGVTVGLLAVDEEGPDLIGRIAQRFGFSRAACERRAPEDLAAIESRVSSLPLRIYDPTWTIEEAARELAAHASGRACLIVDSIQTVQCEAVRSVEHELSEVQRITAAVGALRSVASTHRLIAIATSEANRAIYKTIRRADKDEVNPLAGAKYSGAVEYSARVMLSLKEAKSDDEDVDVVQVEIPKNKHGRRRYAKRGEALFLALHKPSQTITETEAPPDEVEETEAKAEARAEAEDAKADAMAERMLADLVRGNAKGHRYTSRDDLRQLGGRGPNAVKAKAISRLITSGRIEGGRGKPYLPRHAEPEAAE